jgi:hypothetical protein
MVIAFALTAVFSLIIFVLAFLPDLSSIDPFINHDITGFLYYLNLGFYLFPRWLFNLIIANALFWKGAQLTWAIVEWVYKKIPGVN